MLRLGLLILVLSVLHCAEGRKCWHCENAKGNADCLLRGKLTQCLINQEYCQNEIRAIGGGIYFEVTKRCKQDNSCENNKMQNFTGVYPFQCQTEEPHSVCRCCCGFDNCNGPNMTCMAEKPECEEPDAPENGYVTGCYPPYPVGEKCFFKCRYGYKLNGTSKVTCELTGTSSKPEWVPKEKPICESKPCRPLVDPEGGSKTCTDEWNQGSVCTFVCEPGRVLIGSERLKCSHLSIWDEKEPTCEKVDCFPPKPLDPNFIEPKTGDCTDRYNYKSTCSFQCHEDYRLVGIESIECGDPINPRTKKAKWNRPPPKCQKKTCAADLVCPEMKVGEECVVECKSCEEGGGSKICTKDGWDGVVVPCTTIICDSDPPGAPINGDRTCPSIANECGDACAFTCDENYRLVGSPTTRCLDTKAWSHPTPTCERSVCLPDHPECDGNEVGDRCEITCPRCQSGGGEIVCTTNGWSGSLPTCRTITCGSPPDAPANGNRRCTPLDAGDCDDSCTYSCDENYDLSGNPTSTCLESGLWSGIGQIRQCNPQTCEEFSGRVPRADVGSLNCETPVAGVPWMVGTKCTLTCEEGYTAIQNVWQSECIRDTFENIFWDDEGICCVACMTNTKIDMVVLLDKTISEDLWDVRIRAVGGILEYSADRQNFEFNVTFIPFGSDLDLANQVDFMNIEEYQDDEDFMLPLLGSVPVAPGEDSNAGKAMQWALDHIFGFHNGRYPTIVLVTDRAPSDLAAATAAVREMTRKKMHLRILPIITATEADAGANEDILFDLVEKDKFVYTRAADDAEEFNFNALDELITETKKLCNSENQNTAECLVEP